MKNSHRNGRNLGRSKSQRLTGWITRALAALAMAALSPLTLAGQYDWIASKLPADLPAQDSALIAVGAVHSQRYLAAHVNAGDETP